jgi:hypothetical protein
MQHGMDYHGTKVWTGAETKQVWHTTLWLPGLRPDDKKWQPVPMPQVPLQSPTDLAALGDGRFLIGDKEKLLLVAPADNGHKVENWFRAWGDGPDQHFGDHLRFAVDGASLLVSDTDRHRVIWLDWTTWQVLAQFGETDTPGDHAWRLNAPAQASLRGTRAIVADAGNQRLAKCVLLP